MPATSSPSPGRTPACWPSRTEPRHRAVLLAQDTQIRLADLALRTGPGVVPRLEEMSLEEVESHLIRKALDRYLGNVSLYRRLQRYGL